MYTKRRYAILVFPCVILMAGFMLYSCDRGQKPATEGAGPVISLQKGVILVDYREHKRVDVYIDGDIFTSYLYPDELDKPVLFPVRTAKGTIITRGFPLEPRIGERIDHPHHAGVWFSYEDVNGYDFWKGSAGKAGEGKAFYGRILHRGVKRAESRESMGILEIAADWQVPAEDGTWHTLLQELTFYEFSGDEYSRTIDRITRLTAQEDEVILGDNKDGLFAIRVARQFEHPSDEPLVLIEENGEPSEEAIIDNKGVNGRYLNSEGIEGAEVWGKRARWVSLSSGIDDEDITISIFDHPDNAGYPSRWHAREYGLFAINNLGARAFDETADPFQVKLMPGESMVFKHRLYIASGTHSSTEQLEAVFGKFEKK